MLVPRLPLLEMRGRALPPLVPELVLVLVLELPVVAVAPFCVQIWQVRRCGHRQHQSRRCRSASEP